MQLLLCLVSSFAENFRIFFVEIFWSLRHFGHLSHSRIETRCNDIY